jgi:glucose-1-phosphate cytidylyltransferase
MQLIILAGGSGTRISEETDFVPKPMIKIGNKPLLWHIIKYYSIYGFSKFIICGGYKIEVIKKYFKKLKKNSWDIKIVNTGKKSNTGERLRRVKKYTDDTFCLTYGDGLSNVNLNKLVNFHKKSKSIVTLTAVKPIPHFGKLVFKGNKVIKFFEKNIKKENWINGGFFVCNKKIFNFFNKKNMIFESGILSILAKKKKLTAYKHFDFWCCMDNLRDKRYLIKLWLTKKAPWKIWKDE